MRIKRGGFPGSSLYDHGSLLSLVMRAVSHASQLKTSWCTAHGCSTQDETPCERAFDWPTTHGVIGISCLGAARPYQAATERDGRGGAGVKTNRDTWRKGLCVRFARREQTRQTDPNVGKVVGRCSRHPGSVDPKHLGLTVRKVIRFRRCRLSEKLSLASESLLLRVIRTIYTGRCRDKAQDSWGESAPSRTSLRKRGSKRAAGAPRSPHPKTSPSIVSPPLSVSNENTENPKTKKIDKMKTF